MQPKKGNAEMAKSTHNRVRRVAPKRESRAKAKKAGQIKAQSGSKQDQVIALLRRPEGTTIDAIIRVTGWQQHSVRGFFAGVIRKKLGLNLESKKIDGQRVYRILAAKPSKTKTAATKNDQAKAA